MSLNRLPGIANPQNTKRLGHFLTTDLQSVETPNGKKPPMHHAPGAQKSFNYVSYHYMKTVEFFKLRQGVPADLKSAVKKGSTYENGGFVIPL